MRRLTQLDLRETAVTEAGIAKIATLPELRSLNLFSTQVGNAVANTLGAAKALETLYVWQSKIDADGIARIHAALPQVRIVGAPELPTAPLETGKGKGKRGKK